MGAKLKVAGWVMVGAVAGALATMQFQAIARSPVAQLPLEELQQLASVFSMVKSDYVEPVDEKKLITDAISGMVSGLDPHSQYFDKKSFKEFREGTTGRFVGVGIEMSMEDGLVKVVSPIEGSPAFRAGLKSGDLITRIDDTPVKGLTVDQAVKRMRGEPNTKVHADRLPQGREPQLPGDDRARGDPPAERALEDRRARLCLDPRQPVPGPHGRGFRAQARGSLQAGPEPEGHRARPAQRPGRPARGVGRRLGGLPAAATRSSSRPTARSPNRRRSSRPRPSTTCAAAVPTRCAACPRRSRACRWWCWSTKARPRPARSSPARCRTTSARSSWARRPSARARCRPCASCRPKPR